MHDRQFEANASAATRTHREGPARIQAATRAQSPATNHPDADTKTEVRKPLHEGQPGFKPKPAPEKPAKEK